MTIPPGSRGRLRILCLHGYEQDSTIFKTKLRQHIQILQDIADFVFVDAPNVLQPYDIDGMDNMARETASRMGKSLGRTIKGWYWLQSADPEKVCGLETSIAYLESVLETQGPFDGVFGFSQGGLMAAVLCALLEHRYEGLSSACTHARFKFAIIASGYKLSDSKWTYLYAKPLHTPSLHMYGILDSMIHASKSIDLRHVFANAQEQSTVGAHFVPKSPEIIEALCKFVCSFH